MHERTRRRLCRVLFVLLALLPTLATTLWIVAINSPTYIAARRASWEGSLSGELGVRLTCEQLWWPQRDTMRLEQVQLRDPESQELLAHLRAVDILRHRRAWIVTLHDTELPAGQAGRARDILEHVLRRRSTEADKLTIAASRLTVQHPRQATTLHDVQLRLAGSADGPSGNLQFALASNQPAPARLQLVRNRQQSPPTSSWRLETGTAALPAHILAWWFPACERLGDGAQFRGTVQLEQSRGPSSGSIQGEVQRVDLDKLITERFPHKLSGVASVKLQRLQIDEGRIAVAAGTVAANSGGAISHSLLEAAAEHLALQPRGNWPVSDQALWRYDQLAFEFDLTAETLRLRGRCSTPGAILCEKSTVLLHDTPATVPAVALARTLVPHSEVAVPATRETDALLQILPVPAVRPAEAAALPYVPLRLERR